MGTSTLTVKSPYDGSIVAEVPCDDAASIEAKLQAAVSAQTQWRKTPLAERMEAVRQGCGWFETNRETVARSISQQMGKPLAEALGEVSTMLDRAEQNVARAADYLAPEELPPRDGFVRRIEHVPLGVVLDIAAWNYPLLVPINAVVPGLLAGNAVLIKHSPVTPLSGVQFEEAFAGTAAADLVRSLVIDHDQARDVILDPRIAHVAFTGSVRGGHEVYRVVAERLIDVGLELGGKDPAYVAEDADLEFAVANVVEGACYNAGQSCCAVERAYVHRRHYDEFIERARQLFENMKPGDPLEPGTTIGPMARPEAPEFLAGQVQDAVSKGARLVTGGRQGDLKGQFFAPTLLVDVPAGAEIMVEESFGPILPIAAVESDEEAMGLMNRSRFGLTASVWTADQGRAEAFAAGLDTGTIFQNRCDFLDPQLPWTGVGDSGKGSSLSRHGFYGLTRRKAIHFRVRT